MNPLTIWTNAQFAEEPRALLAETLRAHRLLFAPQLAASNLAAAPPDPALLEADVAFGQPDPAMAWQGPRLRWIHLTTAGYTRYDSAEFRAALAARGAQLTNSSLVYAEPCAQHLLAFLLAQARQLPASLENQRAARGWPSLEHRGLSRLLLGQEVLLLGFGAIGRRLAELLAPFELRITALRRHPGVEKNVGVITDESLDAALAAADHVVNILPENPATLRFVNAALLAAMKPGAIFYNAGRGATVDQDALRAALQSGALGAAWLDVTDPEPLPPAHPLWTAPRCHITPHTAGGHDHEAGRVVQHFLDNFSRFTRGAALRDRVI